MRQYMWTTVISIILLTSMPVNAQQYDFDFTNINDSVESISDYADKPIVLDWAASWCGICKQNQETFNDIYEKYKSDVNFLTISYGESGDTLENVEEMKGSYPWTFGLDHENVATEYGVSNGYVWILNEDLSLGREWEYTVVPQNQLVNAIDAAIDGDIEPTDTQDQTNDELNSYGLENNPLFIGFLAITILLFIVILVKSGGDTTNSTKKNVLDDAIEQQKENWDWDK